MRRVVASAAALLKQGGIKVEAALKMEQIYKAFPGVVAVDKVDIEVRHGEVVALIGENGAGKSKLIRGISGAYSKDGGKIYIEGKVIRNYTP